jgi:hypothetical protein
MCAQVRQRMIIRAMRGRGPRKKDIGISVHPQRTGLLIGRMQGVRIRMRLEGGVGCMVGL